MRVFRYFLLSLCLSFSSLLFAGEDIVPININSADAKTLSMTLKGVGPSKAAAIIAYRENYGPFQAVDELVAVKGIGESLVNNNRQLIVLK